MITLSGHPMHALIDSGMKLPITCWNNM